MIYEEGRQIIKFNDYYIFSILIIKIRKQDTIQLSGIFSSEHFQHLKIAVTECQNNTFLIENPWKPVCQTKEFFKEYFEKNKNVRVVFQIVNYIVNPPEPENYIRTFLDDSVFFTIIPGAYVTADIYFQEQEFITDNSILPYKQIEKRKLPIFENGNFRAQQFLITQPSFGDFFFRRDPITYTMNRQFVKISEVISYIGGFSQIFLSISAILVSYHNEYIYSIRLANKLYNFELKQKKNKNKKDQYLKEQPLQQMNTEFTICDHSFLTPQNKLQEKKTQSQFPCEDSKKEINMDKVQNSCLLLRYGSKSKTDTNELKQQEQADFDTQRNKVQINETIEKYNYNKITQLQVMNQKIRLNCNSQSNNIQKFSSEKDIVQLNNNTDKDYSSNYPILKVNSMKIKQDQNVSSQKQRLSNVIDQSNKTHKIKDQIDKEDNSLSFEDDIAEEGDDVKDIVTERIKQPHTQINNDITNQLKDDLNLKPLQDQIISKEDQKFLSHEQIQFESNCPSLQFDKCHVEQNLKNYMLYQQCNQQQQLNQVQLQQKDNQKINSFVDYQDRRTVNNIVSQPSSERVDLIHVQSNVSYQDNQDENYKCNANESQTFTRNSIKFLQNGTIEENKNTYLNVNCINQIFAKSENNMCSSSKNNCNSNPLMQSHQDVKNLYKSQTTTIEDQPITTKRQSYLKQKFTTLLKREENLKMSYQFFLYKLTCRKFFKSEQVLLLEKATKLVRQDLDVSLILYRLKELEKFKKLFLNENQEVLFNFFPKPIISVDKQIELPSRLNISQDIKKDKRKQKMSQISHILNSALNSKVQKAFSVNSKTATAITIAANKFKRPINSKLFEYDSMQAYQRLYEAYKNICSATSTTEFDKKLIMLLGEEVNGIFEQSERMQERSTIQSIPKIIKSKSSYTTIQQKSDKNS